MKIFKIALIFVTFFTFQNLFSQTSISGIISDETGAPLPYADIVIVGTNYGSSANDNGEYSISLPDNFVQGQTITLSAQFIGYIKSEKAIVLSSGESIENFTLEADVIGMDQVVVTGLGISKEKKAVGYSVQYVSAE